MTVKLTPMGASRGVGSLLGTWQVHTPTTNRKGEKMAMQTRVILCLWAGLGMACVAAGPVGSTAAWAGEKTWHFANAWNYTFASEAVTVNNGGNSLAELKKLPDQRFWKASYNDPLLLHGPEYHASTVAPDRNLVAVGSNTLINSSPLQGELIVGKYSQEGKALPGWPKLYTDPYYQWNEGQDVVVDSKGNITVTGYTITSTHQFYMAIWRFDSNGKPLAGWPRYPVGSPAYGTGVIVDGNGSIFACGSSGTTGSNQMVLAKYRPNGTAAAGWPKTYQIPGSQRNFAYDLIQDSDGNLVVAGYTEGADHKRRAMLYKLDSNGNVLAGWPKLWDSGSGNFNEYFAVSQDANGDYCLVGTTQGTTKDDGRLLVTRYSRNGKQRTDSGWPRIYPCNGLRDYSPPDAWRGSVDTAGNMAAAVTCQSDTHIRTLKYTRKAAMFGGFPKTFDRSGYQDVTRSCSVDDLDNIYTVGYSSSGDDYTTFVIKYPPAPYSTARPAVVTKQGVGYTKLTGFSETLGADHQGRVLYQLSPDGANWYYHDAVRWKKAANKYQSNTAVDINAHIETFAAEAGAGTLQVKAFLLGNGAQRVQLDSVSVTRE
jgi:hypothetical protein